MSNRSEEIAEALAKKKALMAEEITAEYFARRPEMLARWGEVGKRRCTEDSVFHLSYLAEAVRFDSPELFVDYIAWAKILLHSLRISESDLRENLELVRSTVARHFKGEDREVVARIISTALGVRVGVRGHRVRGRDPLNHCTDSRRGGGPQCAQAQNVGTSASAPRRVDGSGT